MLSLIHIYPVLTFEDLTLHVDTHQVQHGEHMIRLTKTEYAILKLLLQNPVVETPSVYLELTAQENIREQYRVLGLPDFAGVTELLKLVGLSDTGNKKIKNFSLGMRQRLGIEIALPGDPDFLVPVSYTHLAVYKRQGGPYDKNLRYD